MRMRSRIAQVEPLPLVPPTVIATGRPSPKREGDMRAATSRTRSSPSAIVAGCCAEMCASQSSSEVLLKRGFAASSFGDGLALEQRDEARDLVAQAAPVDDHVHGALLEEEFRALEAFGQRLTHRLLDDARPGEADERAGLGDHHVADEGEARRDPAHGGIGEHRDERLARGRELVERGGRFGHLHQREKAFLHARPARGGEAQERQPFVARGLHRTHETLADDRSHRAAEEAELEGRGHQRHRLDRALHHHERVGLAGLLLRFREALAVLAAVLELERVERHDLGSELRAPLRIEEEVEPLARREPVVEAALGTDMEIVLEVGEVQHRLARRALAPQALGNRLLLLRAFPLDLGWQELAEPAHAATVAASIAWRNSRITSSARAPARSGGASASTCTMRLPITTASATRATRLAVAPSRMPKPTPTGIAVWARMRRIIASTSRVSMWAAPVTPLSDT